MTDYEAMQIYLLACLVAKDTGEKVENFLSDAKKYAESIIVPSEPKKRATPQKKAVSDEDINEVYNAYPTRCPVSDRPLGKSSTDKERIRRLIASGTSKETILAAIDYSKESGAWMKNFSTFLNNLPEVPQEYPIKEKTIWQ